MRVSYTKTLREHAKRSRLGLMTLALEPPIGVSGSKVLLQTALTPAEAKPFEDAWLALVKARAAQKAAQDGFPTGA